jgi:cytochrome P450
MRPPGPPFSIVRSLLYRPGRDPLKFFSELAATYGDLVYVRMGGERLFLVSDPRRIKEILVNDNATFMKGRGLQRAKRLLGEGLLTSEGALHLRQRRLMQPAFHRERIAGYGAVMVDRADRTCRSWSDGATFDLSKEMSRLTLSVVAKTLFDAELDAQAGDINRALTGVLESFWALMLPFAELLERLPLGRFKRGRAARAELDAVIYRMIADRRASGQDHGDLLSMLLAARDPDEGDGGPVMSDRQVRDEAMTLLLAGHETTANALTWTWHLLGSAPAVRSALHDELDRVLGGRLPRVADIPQLGYVEQVVTESMRLYPPAWIIGRRALADYRIDGYLVPQGSLVVFSPYVVHRDPRVYRDADRFVPERWTPAFRASLPPFAYLPFGGGPRRCIGESFAWMELVLIVSTIAQRWSFEPVPGRAVAPQALVTLRPRHGMAMKAVRREQETTVVGHRSPVVPA